MTNPTIQDLLGDFNASPGNDLQHRGPTRSCVTIWLPPDLKARYDKLQEKSGRRFSKKARQLLIELIEIAEARLA